jgi:hypothetical protein
VLVQGVPLKCSNYLPQLIRPAGIGRVNEEKGPQMIFVLRISAVVIALVGVLFTFSLCAKHADYLKAEQFCRSITLGTDRQSVLTKISAESSSRLSFEGATQISIGLPGACQCSVPFDGSTVKTTGQVYCNG